MILSSEKTELFHQGEELFSALEKIYGGEEYFVLQIELRNSPSLGKYTAFSVYSAVTERWTIYNATFKDFLKWFRKKQLLLQKITL